MATDHPGMTLRWAAVADAALPVIEVVPRHETQQPKRRVEVHQAFDRELWAILDGAEQAPEKSLIALLSE